MPDGLLPLRTAQSCGGASFFSLPGRVAFCRGRGRPDAYFLCRPGHAAYETDRAMNDRKPPRLSNWLLNHFGVGRQNPPLAGDLLEEFRSGRSAAWFWRQTLVVILTGLARNA